MLFAFQEHKKQSSNFGVLVHIVLRIDHLHQCC